jgi:plastocyanin
MTPANNGPTLVASFTATPNPVAVGKRVRLDSSGSSDTGGAIVRHLWDLDGNGTYETDSSNRSVVSLRPTRPGTVRVGLRVVDDRGATADTTVAVTATPQRDPAGGPAAGASGPGSTVPDPKAGSHAPAPPAAAAPRRVRKAHKTHRPPARRPAAVAAGDPSVTIKSFAFHPGTISISVGDTVSWTNQDSVSGGHTATANDGSFNTGVLNQGQSASHTFTKAGTFAYICAIHPFMKGTIVVAAAAAPSTGSSGSGGSGGGSGGGGSSSGNGAGTSGSTTGSTGQSSATTGATGSGLPHTGLQLGSVFLVAAAMLLGGGLLRRFANL